MREAVSSYSPGRWYGREAMRAAWKKEATSLFYINFYNNYFVINYYNIKLILLNTALVTCKSIRLLLFYTTNYNIIQQDIISPSSKISHALINILSHTNKKLSSNVILRFRHTLKKSYNISSLKVSRTSTQISYNTFKIYPQTLKRFMHSGVNDNIIGEINNAFAICGGYYINNKTPPQYIQEASMNAITFVAEKLDQGLNFSQIINMSYQELNYTIYRDSFVMILESLNKNGFGELILPRDDIGIFNNQMSLNPNWRSLYDNKMTIKNTIPPENNNNVLVEDKTNSDNNFKISDNSSNSSTDSSSSLEEDSASLFNNGNNNEIILYTVISLIVIISIAWYIKKYHKNTLNSTELDNENENALNSIYENSFDYSTIITILRALIIPTILITLYNYRYYYYYYLKIYFNNILPNKSNSLLLYKKLYVKKSNNNVILNTGTFFVLSRSYTKVSSNCITSLVLKRFTGGLPKSPGSPLRPRLLPLQSTPRGSSFNTTTPQKPSPHNTPFNKNSPITFKTSPAIKPIKDQYESVSPGKYSFGTHSNNNNTPNTCTAIAAYNRNNNVSTIRSLQENANPCRALVLYNPPAVSLQQASPKPVNNTCTDIIRYDPSSITNKPSNYDKTFQQIKDADNAYLTKKTLPTFPEQSLASNNNGSKNDDKDKDLKKQQLKNPDGSTYETCINESTTANTMENEKLINEGKVRRLIKIAEDKTVTIKTDQDKVIVVGKSVNDLKISPLGRGYVEYYESLLNSFKTLYPPLPFPITFDMFHIGVLKLNEKEVKDTFISQPEHKHFFNFLFFEGFAYITGYFSSQTSNRLISSTTRFKEYHDKQEYNKDIPGTNKQYFRTFDVGFVVPLEAVEFIKHGTGYLTSLTSDAKGFLLDKSAMLFSKPSQGFTIGGYTKENLLDYCKLYDYLRRLKKPHPISKNQHEVNKKATENLKKNNEEKYKKNKEDNNKKINTTTNTTKIDETTPQ